MCRELWLYNKAVMWLPVHSAPYSMTFSCILPKKFVPRCTAQDMKEMNSPRIFKTAQATLLVKKSHQCESGQHPNMQPTHRLPCWRSRQCRHTLSRSATHCHAFRLYSIRVLSRIANIRDCLEFMRVVTVCCYPCRSAEGSAIRNQACGISQAL